MYFRVLKCSDILIYFAHYLRDVSEQKMSKIEKTRLSNRAIDYSRMTETFVSLEHQEELSRPIHRSRMVTVRLRLTIIDSKPFKNQERESLGRL